MTCGKPLTALQKRSRRRRVLFISFLVVLTIVIGGTVGVSVAVTTGNSRGFPLLGLPSATKEPILTITERGEWRGSPPTIEGAVRNDGTEPVQNVYIVARIHGDRYDVARTQKGWTDTAVTAVVGSYVAGYQQPLLPGESRAFKIFAPGAFTSGGAPIPGRTELAAETREPPATRVPPTRASAGSR